jgi:hypothetical protein
MSNSVAANLPKEMQSHHYPILYQVEDTHWWYVGRRRIIQSLVEKDSCDAEHAGSENSRRRMWHGREPEDACGSRASRGR